MRVLLHGRFDCAERDEWLAALRSAASEVQWLDLPAARAAPADVVAAVVANPEPGSLQGLPALRLVQSLWAGVDRIVADPTVPTGVPLARMVDPAMTRAMVETALWATLALHRGFFAYARRQREAVWRPHAQRLAGEVSVVILGAGEMGRAVGEALAAQQYRVALWRRGAGAPGDLHCVNGEAALAPLLGASDIVINLLPLTDETRGLIDRRFFAAMKPGAALVNLGRGAHLVEADLLAALDEGRLRDAVLDVFQREPLPSTHPLWAHPRVTVLPHAAALTDPRSAARVVAANLRSLGRGAPLAHLVDRQRGY
jgi:glyoxylate/hydroxypyruvate reductase A